MRHKSYSLALAIAAIFALIALSPVIIAQTQKTVPADVTVQPAEPQVVIERAEPVVKVEQAEPKVEIQQDEAELKVEQGQPQMVQQDTAAQSQPQTTSAPQPQTNTIDSSNPIYQLRVSDFEDREVVNSNGEEIGEVDELVVDPRAKRLLAVLEIGGFLGLGERKIAVELQELQIRDDVLVLDTMESKDQLKQRPEYNDDQYVELEDFDAPLGDFGEADFARFEELMSQ